MQQTQQKQELYAQLLRATRAAKTQEPAAFLDPDHEPRQVKPASRALRSTVFYSRTKQTHAPTRTQPKGTRAGTRARAKHVGQNRNSTRAGECVLQACAHKGTFLPSFMASAAKSRRLSRSTQGDPCCCACCMQWHSHCITQRPLKALHVRRMFRSFFRNLVVG